MQSKPLFTSTTNLQFEQLKQANFVTIICPIDSFNA